MTEPKREGHFHKKMTKGAIVQARCVAVKVRKRELSHSPSVTPIVVPPPSAGRLIRLDPHAPKRISLAFSRKGIELIRFRKIDLFPILHRILLKYLYISQRIWLVYEKIYSF